MDTVVDYQMYKTSLDGPFFPGSDLVRAKHLDWTATGTLFKDKIMNGE